MSLLPQQIPTPTTKLVDGNGLVNKTWWLFFYNVATNSIGQQTSVDDVLVFLENQLDADQVPENPQSAQYDSIDYPVVFPADAQAFGEPQVPVSNQAQPEIAITLGASPATYTAPFAGSVLVQGGTVSLIELSRSGTFRTAGFIDGFVPVARGDQVRVTYVVLPTAFFFPS